MKALWLALSLLLSAAAPLAYADDCKPTNPTEIAGLFDRWNGSLQTGDPARVVANYAQRSILLPTLSNKPRLTPEDKIDYFEHFLAKKPVGQIDLRFIDIGCNSALDSGLYTFRFGDGSIAHARYTFTYAWDGKQWLITSHHSSLMPEPEPH
ncbi:MAG: DUF4440 domain-containing protein [Paludibacterium sp.]|uniref:DUF4440 domain-containing protein n=1 Tax=Paludibacterium sp. TaxID=1917523 RepID=UPI0025DAA190|nr:DUF4440 domain-containing protein [Paludibacterium sp.]MBV8046779.1 DUF4440 domain-containing protein [Paludibacterium sp.]MBV8648923.1 DUF4440 domain-containing protein [Paludibacterium sp.]